MSNYSAYAVFLDYDPVRGICWSLAIIGLPCNGIVIFRLLYLNFAHSRLKNLPRIKQILSFAHRRYTINHNPSIFLLFNLAVCDFIGSLYLLILAGSDIYYTAYYRHKYGLYPNYSDIENEWIITPTCTTERIFSQIALLMSILMTFIVAIDRFILVVYPHSRRKINMKSARIITAICWIFSLAIAILAGLESAQSVAKHPRTRFNIIGQLCLPDPSRSFIVQIITYFEIFLGCSLYIASMILYIVICRKLSQSKTLFRSTSSGMIEKRVSIILASVVFTNIFTYLPVTLFSILGQVLPSYDPDEGQLYASVVALLYLNTAVNPILFLMLSLKTGRNTSKVGQSSDGIRS